MCVSGWVGWLCTFMLWPYNYFAASTVINTVCCVLLRFVYMCVYFCESDRVYVQYVCGSVFVLSVINITLYTQCSDLSTE